jgi:hypothetical protein
MRAMSLNLLGHHGDWPARRELLAAGYHLAHQTLGLSGTAATTGPRWPGAGRSTSPVGGVMASDHYGVVADRTA